MPPQHLIVQGDARRLPLADTSVHCVITSPPYFGLRDYGTASFSGGDPTCDHRAPSDGGKSGNIGQYQEHPGRFAGPQCYKCGAARHDLQIGLELRVEDYIADMVACCREVRRVLRADGTFWLNLGDTYANDKKWGGSTSGRHALDLHGKEGPGRRRRRTGLGGKQLLGVPWRVALALQADGWVLRNDIIWHKSNPMPESPCDRITRAHEYLFLFAKSPKYYFDVDAIAEPAIHDGRVVKYAGTGKNAGAGDAVNDRRTLIRREVEVGATRRKRSVWTVPTKPYKGAHFATFPPDLIIPCILAGTSSYGVCAACGTPWARLTHKVRRPTRPGINTKCLPKSDGDVLTAKTNKWNHPNVIGNRDPQRHCTTTETVGWIPRCLCDPVEERVPAVVLDPFAGVCTTSLAAARLDRSSICVDLRADHCEWGRARLLADKPPSRPRIRKPAPENRVPLRGQLEFPEFGGAA